MTPFMKNNEALTPRALAEKLGKQKFHRVIKTLKNYEIKQES